MDTFLENLLKKIKIVRTTQLREQQIHVQYMYMEWQYTCRRRVPSSCGNPVIITGRNRFQSWKHPNSGHFESVSKSEISVVATSDSGVEAIDHH